MLQKLFGRGEKPEEAAADALYRAIIEQARQAAFYREGGVPDSLDGRFELVVLHAHLVMRRLKDQGAEAAAVSQALFDLMFKDMDQNLREIGVGDLSVGKKIKKMAEAFYGRVSAYDAGLEVADESLAEAIGRNLLGTVESSAEQRQALAAYALACDRALQAQDLAELCAGRPAFAGFPVS